MFLIATGIGFALLVAASQLPGGKYPPEDLAPAACVEYCGCKADDLVSEGGTASARDRGAAADEIDRLRAAIADATAILSRVAGEGSVIAQIAAASDEELRRSPSSQLSELTTRLEELAELARHLRAESASAVWDRLDPSCQRGL